MKQWTIAAALFALLYALHVLSEGDELRPVNLTAEDCRHVQC